MPLNKAQNLSPLSLDTLNFFRRTIRQCWAVRTLQKPHYFNERKLNDCTTVDTLILDNLGRKLTGP